MPRLTAVEVPNKKTRAVEFVFSVSMDMMQAMYFTSLVETSEGVEGWPVAVRGRMAPDLLEELDFLFNYPAGDPGLGGTLADLIFINPQAWGSIESLVSFVREMPDGHEDSEANPGIQGLIFQTMFKYLNEVDTRPFEGLPPRDAIEARLRSLDDRDADLGMTLYDRPGQLRERLARLIERFYEEHYREELPNRRPALEASVAAHRDSTREEAIEVVRRVTGRPNICIEDYCAGPYDRLIFTPSLDMGPYTSCADFQDPAVHGLVYPCEPQFLGRAEAEAEETTRMARIYKALGDEQRLRILGMLKDEELYAQEIVDRLDLHQSVVSRHLSFLKAVGLLKFRKQNNMKYYSLNPEIAPLLGGTIDLFTTNTKGGPA